MGQENNTKNKKNTKKNNSAKKPAAKHVSTKKKTKVKTDTKSNKAKKSNSSKASTQKKQVPENKTKPPQKSNNKANNKESSQTKNKSVKEKTNNTPASKHERVKSKKELREEQKARKVKLEKTKKIVALSCLGILGLYLLGCLFFTICNFPNTVVGDTDVSFHTYNFMKDALTDNQGQYMFCASTKDSSFNLEIKGEEVNFNFDVDSVSNTIVDMKNPLAWPYEIFINHDFMDSALVSFDQVKTFAICSDAITQYNENSTKPQNANFVVNPISKQIEVKEEIKGNTLNQELLTHEIVSCVGSVKKKLDVNDTYMLLPTLYSNDSRCEEALEKARVLIKSVLTLQMGGTNISTLDINNWEQMLQLKESYIAGLNDELLAAWVADLANRCDTLGKTRTFTTPYGKQCSVSGGDHIGWQINQPELIEQINIKCVQGISQIIDVPCAASLNGYGGPGQRDWGARYIDVDLSQQHARMYGDNGALLWESDIVSGKPSTATPCGVYTVKQVCGYTVLRGDRDPATGKPSYESPVQHWMPFVGSSIGFHDASWQSKFGGNWYLEHGSHGCINLSNNAAASLHAVISTGDIVVVHT